ncbi:hypothetical protein CONLIGDRAFT_649855 [Coniochaeta ligniaria NRRL 30616]|uniref:Uncharacterized protein n=1 Tax=Coniochaeta ligniaria NRRL 30616 TaxID=1408157 RepID=A0A1J7J2F7_9PEZI|nr:hypothetical protein CONLIGDRAFT_649855 [Coniochaeta ligniaria NRRL 30616]
MNRQRSHCHAASHNDGTAPTTETEMGGRDRIGGKHRTVLVNPTRDDRHRGHRRSRPYSYTGSKANTDYGSATSSSETSTEEPTRKPYKCRFCRADSNSRNGLHSHLEKLRVNISTIRYLDESLTSPHLKMDSLTEIMRNLTAQNDHLAAQNAAKTASPPSPRRDPSPRRSFFS